MIRVEVNLIQPRVFVIVQFLPEFPHICFLDLPRWSLIIHLIKNAACPILSARIFITILQARVSVSNVTKFPPRFQTWSLSANKQFTKGNSVLIDKVSITLLNARSVQMLRILLIVDKYVSADKILHENHTILPAVSKETCLIKSCKILPHQEYVWVENQKWPSLALSRVVWGVRVCCILWTTPCVVEFRLLPVHLLLTKKKVFDNPRTFKIKLFENQLGSCWNPNWVNYVDTIKVAEKMIRWQKITW